MRAARLVACAAAAAAFALAPAASGAGTACNLVTDAQGDQAHSVAGVATPLPVSPDLDVVSADVASTKRYVTAVVRVAALHDIDTAAPTGRHYEVRFQVGTRTYALEADRGVDGYTARAWDESRGVGLGEAAVAWDYSARAVVVTAPAAAFGLKNGALLTNISVLTGHHYGTGGGRGVGTPVGWSATVGNAGIDDVTDTAATTKAYRAGTPSCVTVAR